MIGYHADLEKIVDSEGKCCAFGDWLQWLLNNDLYEDKIAYDLDHFVACLLRHIGISREQGQKLLDAHKLYLQGTGCKLAYYANKVFTIDYGHGKGHAYTYFYNAKQYTDTHHEDRKDIEYVLNKAVIAQCVGEQVLAAYKEIGIASGSLTSPIKAFERSGLMPNAPTVDNMPPEAGEYAYACTHGNWVEAFSLGTWSTAYDHDVNGAYASELAKLMDLRIGGWLHSDKYVIPPMAAYGFAKGILRAEAAFHPFLVGSGDMLYTPTGEWETYLTLQEMKFLRRNKLESFELHDGWWWIPSEVKEARYPYKNTVHKLWSKRQEAAPMTSSIIKRILAGIWGKTLELRGKADDVEFGPLFNPVYGAVVEANVRLKTARFALEAISHGCKVLHIAVDGLILDKPIPTEALGNSELGQWRLSSQGKCIIVGSGIVGMEGKPADEDFSINYEVLQKLLEGDPKAKRSTTYDEEYKMRKLAPVTLSKALHDDWDKLGELEELERVIHIGDERKRCYPIGPKHGHDILTGQYSSEPWDIAIVSREANGQSKL